MSEYKIFLKDVNDVSFAESIAADGFFTGPSGDVTFLKSTYQLNDTPFASFANGTWYSVLEIPTPQEDTPTND